MLILVIARHLDSSLLMFRRICAPPEFGIRIFNPTKIPLSYESEQLIVKNENPSELLGIVICKRNDMDRIKNGDGKQIVMILYGVDGFSDEEPFIFV